MHILIGKTGVLRLFNLPGKSLVLALAIGWAATIMGQAQDIFVQSEKYTLYGYESRLDSLRKVNGASLCCYEPQIELAALLALGHYPELRNIKIKVVYKNRLSAPIKASPVLWGMFRSRKKRTYKIAIEKKSFVDRISLNKQVGLIGHELAHFIHFQQKSYGGMLIDGIRYITSNDFEYKFETGADTLTIEYGLGWQLYDLRLYLSREQILEHMEKTGLYFDKHATTSAPPPKPMVGIIEEKK